MKTNFISIFIVLTIIFSAFELNAQTNILNAVDPSEIGKKDKIQQRQDEDKKLEYGYVDDRDILFSKVIWEVVDLSQKVNFPYLYPTDTSLVGNERRPLIHHLIQGMKNNKITKIYADGKFNEPVSYQELADAKTFKNSYINNKGKNFISDSGGREEVVKINNISLGEDYDSFLENQTDEFGEGFSSISEWKTWMDTQVDLGLMDDTVIKNYNIAEENAIMRYFSDEYGDKYVSTDYFDYEMVSAYAIKGIWYFDKKVAELKYRPLAIAPIAWETINWSDEQFLKPEDRNPPVELFWIYYPDARDVLQKSYVFSDKNSFVRKSFDELINARRFHTVVYLEENMYEDRELSDYIQDDPFMRLLESERIKEKIRNFEHDMWSW
tara:strand:- start:1115 stop:2257 length:1143 start_codon:yes stop_codon:yes gene_type:complete